MEEFLDGFRAHNYDLFFTNERITVKQDFADKYAGVLGLFGGVIGYGIAKAVTSGSRTTHNEMFKKMQGKFDQEIARAEVKKIEVGRSGNVHYFKIISTSDDQWFFYRGKTDFEDRLKKVFPHLLEKRDI
jgi:hypothetical protein